MQLMYFILIVTHSEFKFTKQLNFIFTASAFVPFLLEMLTYFSIVWNGWKRKKKNQMNSNTVKIKIDDNKKVLNYLLNLL